MPNFIERNIITIIVVAVFTGMLIPNILSHLVPFIPYLLGFVMLCVGINLKRYHFIATWDLRWQILVVLILKFLFISLGAFLIAKIFKLSLLSTIGLVILGSSPGGTAANIYSLLAKSNLALTVVLTMISTILAPLVMPSLLFMFMHKSISISYFSMAIKSFEIIVLPIFLGILINTYFPKIGKIKNLLPTFSIIGVAIIVMVIIAMNRTEILNFPILIIIACLFLNIYSFIVAAVIAYIFNFDNKSAHSILFEYGMLDSGLATVLAMLFFGPIAALPSSIYSILQNITGPIIVKFLQFRGRKSNYNSRLRHAAEK